MRRKVLFTYGMSNDMLLVITDATKEDIESYLSEHPNKDFYDSLIDNHYTKVLHDSELELDNDNVDVIGYDKVYDMNEY